MAHHQQQNFFKTVLASIKIPGPAKVVDFGSLDINGGVKQLIDPTWDYTGIDLDKGPNVDLIQPGQLVDLKSESFDVTLSSELFEHTPYWKEIFAQMCRLTKPGGVVIFTCAGVGRKEHGTTRSDMGYSSPFTVRKGDEYYKNITSQEAEESVAVNQWFSKYGFYDEYATHDLYFVGVRNSSHGVIPYLQDELFDQLKSLYPRKYWKLQTIGPRFLPQALIEIYFQVANRSMALLRNFVYSIYVKLGIKSKFTKNRKK